jgi:hypothetical protein
MSKCSVYVDFVDLADDPHQATQRRQGGADFFAMIVIVSSVIGCQCDCVLVVC